MYLLVSLMVFAMMFMIIDHVQLAMLQSDNDLPFLIFGKNYNCDDVRLPMSFSCLNHVHGKYLSLMTFMNHDV